MSDPNKTPAALRLAITRATVCRVSVKIGPNHFFTTPITRAAAFRVTREHCDYMGNIAFTVSDLGHVVTIGEHVSEVVGV